MGAEICEPGWQDQMAVPPLTVSRAAFVSRRPCCAGKRLVGGRLQMDVAVLVAAAAPHAARSLPS